LAANQFMTGLPGMTAVDLNNPNPMYYTSYGPGQGGIGGQQLVQDWSQMNPSQQQQYSQMIAGTWQPPAAAPAAATPTAAPAPAPVITPPSVQNITTYQGTASDPSGVNAIDPTSTTTTGTPGVPTTGLQAKTYDPNKIATTGTGSATDASGNTNYSTDPKDQTKQILSAKGGAIPARPVTRFAGGASAVTAAMNAPNYVGPNLGGGWSGTPYAQLAPNQQAWANTQQGLLGQELTAAGQDAAYWGGGGQNPTGVNDTMQYWNQMTTMPDAIWPTPAPTAPTPLNEPGPSAQNITTPQVDVTKTDPTSTTTTGTPGVPTTGVQAATYDPNKIATTGKGSKTDASGNTNYSTDPKDTTTQILSRRGGPITQRVTSDASARSIGTRKYDDGGGVSPSMAGPPPGATGGSGAIPPIYYNPATYAAAGAPVGKGVSATSAPTFGAGAIPSLPMARGGSVAFDDGGMVGTGDEGLNTMQAMDFADARDDQGAPAAPATPTSDKDPGWYIGPDQMGSAAPTAPTTPAAPLDHSAPPPDPTTPQIKDDQGNPSRGLIGAISDGLHWLGDHLGLAGSAQAGTLPPAIAQDPQTQTNRQQHVTNDPDGATYMTHQNVEELKDYADPGHQLNDAYRNIAALEAGYKFALSRGDEATAGRLAASMLHYSVLASQNLSEQAAKALYNGDKQDAVNKLNQASDAIPDGRLVHATLNNDGTVTIQGKNLNGQVEWQQHGAAATILEHATALGRSGKLQWDSLESQAAKYDSTFAGMVKNRQANATQDALDRRQTEREQHQQDVADARQKAKEDAAAASAARVAGAVGSNVLQPVTRTGNAAPPVDQSATPAATPASVTTSASPESAAAAPTTPNSGQTAPATPPIGANRGITGHGGSALPAPPNPADRPSPQATDVSFDDVVSRINNQENQTNASDAAAIRSRYIDPDGNILYAGKPYARPPEPNMTGLSKPEQQQAMDQYVKGPLADYNAKAKEVQDALNKDVADNRDLRSKQFQTLRDQVGREFTEGQTNKREAFSQGEQNKRMAFDTDAKALAVKTAEEHALYGARPDGDVRKTFAMEPDASGKISGKQPAEFYKDQAATMPDGTIESDQTKRDAYYNKEFTDRNQRGVMDSALTNGYRYSHDLQPAAVADALRGVVIGSYEAVPAAVPVVGASQQPLYAITITRPSDGVRTTVVLPRNDWLNIQDLHSIKQKQQAQDDADKAAPVNNPYRAPVKDNAGQSAGTPISRALGWQRGGAIPPGPQSSSMQRYG
jgi:hypothetical protein